jgi:hypothetical protein
LQYFSQLIAVHDLAEGEVCISRVGGKLHGIDEIDVKSQELQGKDGRLVADVSVDDM